MPYYHVTVRETIERVVTYGVQAGTPQQADEDYAAGLVMATELTDVIDSHVESVKQRINGRLVTQTEVSETCAHST